MRICVCTVCACSPLLLVNNGSRVRLSACVCLMRVHVLMCACVHAHVRMHVRVCLRIFVRVCVCGVRLRAFLCMNAYHACVVHCMCACDMRACVHGGVRAWCRACVRACAARFVRANAYCVCASQYARACIPVGKPRCKPRIHILILELFSHFQRPRSFSKARVHTRLQTRGRHGRRTAPAARPRPDVVSETVIITGKQIIE